MRPLRLRLQAFGPFAREQVLDFGSLQGREFFLIHGPTGAGKTSVLDGLCFALFGVSSGAEREARELRSHHADPATCTEVELVFALGEACYRVRRVPEQMRKARRGDGLVRQLQEAELHRLDDAGPASTATPPQPPGEQLLASGWREVTERVTALLGFHSAQFRQVIVLAQGQFSQFLKASSKEREPILQVLFGTALYKRIEEQLKQAADQVAAQARDAGAQQQALLDQAGVADLAALQARQAQAQALWQARQADEGLAQAAQGVAEQALQQGLAADRAWTECHAAAAAVQAVAARQPEADAQQARRDAAERAERIRPQAQAHAAAAQALARARDDDALQAHAVEQAAAAQASATQACAQLLAGQAAHDAAAARVRALEQLLVQARGLAALRAELARAVAAQAAAHRAAAQARDAAAAAQARCQALQAEQGALQQPAARAELLARAQADLAARHAALAELAADETRARAAQARTAQAQAVVDQALAAHAQAQAARAACWTRWLAGQSARLAQALHAGQPCPVCGSAEHPAPAHAGADVVDDQALAQADAAQQATADMLERARARLAQDQRTEAEATAQAQARARALADGPAGDALQAALAQATREAADARAAAQRLAAIGTELADAQARVLQADRALTDAQARAQEATAGHAAAQARVDERAAGLPPDLGTPEALQAEGQRLAQQVQDWQARLAAAQRAQQAAELALATATARRQSAAEFLTRAQAEATQQAAAWQQALAQAGFADAQAHAAASLGALERESLERAITAHGQALAAAQARHARAQAAVQDLPVPDLPALHAAAEQARAAHAQAARATEQALQAWQADSQLAGRLDALGGAHAQLEQRHRLLRGLSDTATGQNPARLSFQRYVLATLLEEVLAAATLRLRAMSRGRYALLRRPDPTDARSAGGLELDVADEHTGTTRPVHTLSGGESFLASLALALGLADVVQARSGGVRLDALFVDEGFGTLDPEALEMAIRTLKDLQAAGRLVGIISHVAELKEWIPTRLELRASPAGSTAAFVL